MEPSKNHAQSEEEEDVTVALKRKRARRVSFADNEVTSVHVFRRDDDSSSPSEAPSDPSLVGFFRDLASDSDDDEEQPQLGPDAEAGNSFLRPIGSPSPGGSSTADDVDDDGGFHGPVSACFIRPDRLSDSGVSDDVTMDSTAFSLHYRSLARSDSGDIKTRQFGLSTPNSQGSFMELTEAKRPGEVVLDAVSAGRDSNDMSIEGDNQRSYQFDRLSPAFNAILAEGGAPKDSPQPSHSSIKARNNCEIKEFIKDATMTVPICRHLDFENANRGTPLRVDEDKGMVLDSDRKSDQVNRNLIPGFTPLSLSGRKQLFMSTPNSSTHAGNKTLPLEQSGLFGPAVCVSHGAAPSSVHRTISKMKTLETTPTMLSLKEGMDRLKARLSKYSPGFSLSNKKDHEYKQDETRQTPLQEKLFSLSPASNRRKGFVDSNGCGIQSLKNICKSSQNEETVDTKMDERNLNLIPAHVSYNDETPKAVEMAASPSQMTHLTKVVNVDLEDSPVEKGKDEIPVLSPTIQEAITQLRSLQDPPRMQDLSPKGNLDGHCLDSSYHSILQVAQSPLTKSGIEISSGKKRKGVEILSNGDNIDKIGRIDGSPEVHENGNGDLQLVLEQTGSMRSEIDKLADQTWKDGDLILKKFLAETNQLLPPSVDKLNLRLIGRLEDILVHMQKVKKAEILCSEIQSQHKITDPPNILRDKRVAETRTLLYNIAYEKAKLQLMHLKRDKLLKKVQQVSSGLQECEMIKLTFIPSSSNSEAMDTQADDSHTRTTLFSSHGKCQVSCKKVLEKKQELETLDSKAKSLSEFLCRYCKIEGDQSYTNAMKVVSEENALQVNTPKFEGLVTLNMLWEIEDFVRKDGCFIVCLNYCGYITQRFTVNTGQSSIIISNNLNDMNIGKTFPNLDAFSAFVFVLNPRTTKKCIGSSSMAHETQITSSLLSNLLDVVEEVQSARIEIRNLVDAKFYSHSVQRLDLQLGVYPGEVFPSQIYDPSSGEQKSLLVDEIRNAAERVRVGYSRIIRLCRCIDQAVQASTK
ncbi:hypothetical protein CR513_34042, partial [Mucuna pruriens]